MVLAAALSLPLVDPAWAGPPAPVANEVPAATARAVEGGYHHLSASSTTSARPGRRSGTTVPVPGAEALAYDASTETVYVASETSRTIAVIDARSCNARRRDCHAPVATLPTGSEPSGAVIDAKSRTLYLANHGDSTVAAYDLRRCSARSTSGCGPAVASIPVPDRPTGLALDQRRHTAYAGSDGTRVSVLDTAACNGTTRRTCTGPVALIDVGSSPLNPAVDPATDTLYVPRHVDDDTVDSDVAVIDLRTCNAAVTVGCGTDPVTTRVGPGAIFALADPRTHTLYVNNLFSNTVSVLDQSTCSARNTSGCARSVVATIGTRLAPQALALDRRTRTLYVMSDLDVVSAVDVRRCNATSTAGCGARLPALQADGGPFGIALSPQTGTLYLAARVDGNLAALDARSCSARRTDGCRRKAPSSPAGSFGNTVDPIEHTYYQALQEPRQLGLLDTAACNASRLSGCGQPLVTVDVGKEYGVLLAVPNHHTLYANDQGAGVVDVIDTRTCHASRPTGCAPLASVPVPDLSDIWVNGTTGTIYLTQSTGTITILPGATCNATDRSGCGAPLFVTPVGDGLGAAWIDERTNTFYVHADHDQVLLLPGAACDAGRRACRVVGTTPSGPGAVGIWGDTSTKTLYTANFADGDLPGTVSVIDLRRCQAADTSGCDQTWPTIATARSPFGIQVLPKTRRLLVTHFLAGAVSVVDVRRCTGSDHRGCGATPKRIATGEITANIRLDTRRHTAYVLNGFDATVNVIDYRRPCRTGLCFR